MPQPLISIIVPVYNAARFLPRCLESLQGQTYTNLEIICVNDGSTDDSGRILDEYAARDARLKVIHQENAGVSAARNRGLDIATGEYVAFVDADDWVDTEAYATMAAQFAEDIDWVAMGVVVEGPVEKDSVLAEYFNRLPQGKIKVTAQAFSELNISLPTKVYKRTLIELNQLRFPEGIAYGEDNAFMCCLIATSRHGYKVPGRYYHYRQHGGSATHSRLFKERLGSDLLKGWEFVHANYERMGVQDKFWPMQERLFIEYSYLMCTGDSAPESREKAWFLVQKYGLHRKSHHPEMHRMRMHYMPRWERWWHWFKGPTECYGIAGIAICSITYTATERVIRFMGRILMKLKTRTDE